MLNYNIGILALVFAITLSSCHKQDDMDFSIVENEATKAVHLTTNTGSQRVPSRKLIQISTSDTETGEYTTTFDCSKKGSNCDIGKSADQRIDEIDYNLLQERKNVLEAMADLSSYSMSNYFKENDHSDLFPYLYQKEVFEKITAGEIRLYYQDNMFLIKDSKDHPLFGYQLK